MDRSRSNSNSSSKKDRGGAKQAKKTGDHVEEVAKLVRRGSTLEGSVVGYQGRRSNVVETRRNSVITELDIRKDLPSNKQISELKKKQGRHIQRLHSQPALDLQPQGANLHDNTHTSYSKKVDDCLTRDPNLKDEQVKVILQSFSALDENGDGKISKGEIARAYRLAGFNPTPTELVQIVKEHDVNNDGYIDFEEYFNVMRTKMIKLDFDKDRLKTAFRVLDLDQDGLITVEELRHALTKSGDHFTEKEIKEIVSRADKNQDGKIDYNEFVDADLCKSVF